MLPPRSYLQLYFTKEGHSECTIGILPTNDPEIVLGVNFLENYTVLFDIEHKEVCMRQEALLTKIYPIAFPFAPLSFDQWPLKIGVIMIIVFFLLTFVSLIVWSILPQPGIFPDERSGY